MESKGRMSGQDHANARTGFLITHGILARAAVMCAVARVTRLDHRMTTGTKKIAYPSPSGMTT
jgi:hypothetical protein